MQFLTLRITIGTGCKEANQHDGFFISKIYRMLWLIAVEIASEIVPTSSF